MAGFREEGRGKKEDEASWNRPVTENLLFGSAPTRFYGQYWTPSKTSRVLRKHGF